MKHTPKTTTVRDIPYPLWRVLTKVARLERRSFNSQLIFLLETVLKEKYAEFMNGYDKECETARDEHAPTVYDTQDE